VPPAPKVKSESTGCPGDATATGAVGAAPPPALAYAEMTIIKTLTAIRPLTIEMIANPRLDIDS